jgi:hypothetical protein
MFDLFLEEKFINKFKKKNIEIEYDFGKKFI